MEDTLPKRPKHVAPGFEGPNGRMVIARRNKGWTQKMLAEATGASTHSISNWESGKQYPNLGTQIATVADALGVTLAWLLGGEESNGSRPAAAA